MNRPSLKHFYIKSFGCQMNSYDGERMSELLESQGMKAAEEAATADLVVLNTCHIREKAAEKVYSEIGRLRRPDGSSPMIALAGCVAQAEGAEVLARTKMVDIVVGPQAYHHLPELIEKAASGKVVDIDMPLESKFDALPERRQVGASAFLTVQEGCDKFCTYCVVPYTRGAEVSRPWSRIVKEAHALVDKGAREITLLGQNVNAWTGEDEAGRSQGLDGLIRALAKIDGLERIRYTTSHPNDMTEGLIEAHGEIDKLMPFLHLPVQSGSNRILKAMNRAHTAESYLTLMNRLKEVRPDIALSGDFIVGFPGESEEDFQATLDLISEVGYSLAFSFAYSPRPGTPAADMDNQIDPEISRERLQRLQALLNQQQFDFNQQTIGRKATVLIERKGKKADQMIGKSPWLQSVIIEEPVAIGDLVEVTLTDAGPNSVKGQFLDQKQFATA
ncbi:tRNA (N6-isopentenyl adenosine(37)-C2)-methylthiotransferase MiaB [Zymomonas mobilis]|uniref:tRNA (N6-isopentenyl adenosine(37)-C2)-methylthiotransferase MiaB n=1 Tax=Zymomonas mobilis TaxID=542 RepID=UPI0039EBF37C